MGPEVSLKATILLVGVGKLGLRYLEGILQTQNKIDLYIYDISRESVILAKTLINEQKINKKNIKVNFVSEIIDLPYEIDLLIITTTADVRAELVSTFSSKFRIKSWILEKLLTQSLEDLNKLENIFKNNQNAWVNMPRRVMSWHKEIKCHIPKNKLINAKIAGSNWGLACNSIHFIDLFSWWTNEDLYSIDSSNLENKWVKSKRQGFFEINGCLRAVFSKGSSLRIISNSKENNFFIRIKTDEQSLLLDYKDNIFYGPNKIKIKGKEDLQSQMSKNLIEDILNNNFCDLPKVNDCISQYRIFLKSMINHWNNCHNTSSLHIPIT